MLIPPGVTLAVMLWGIGAPSYWRDEVATVSAVSRSLPQLVRLLGHIDAVHGLYYLLLWPVTAVAGTGELVTRLPSALAMAAADLGVVLIARRLCSRQAALYAGLVFAILPAVSVQGHNARPYAMVTAAAAWSGYLLLRAVDDPRPARFGFYGLALTLTGYLHLFALLLVPAHTITLMGLGGEQPPAGGGPPSRAGQPVAARRPLVVRCWLVTVAAVGIAVVPAGVFCWLQRAQIAWLPRPGWHDIGAMIIALAGGSAAPAALIGFLAALGGVRGLRRTRNPAPGLTWLAAPWLLVPPAMLLAASQLSPAYSFQYVVFCLPAVALPAGAGMAWLGWPWRPAALVLAAVLVLPSQLDIRVPGSGGSLWAAARVLAASERPGDAVIYPAGGSYPGPSIPADNLAYPDEFGRLRDIGLGGSAAATGELNAGSVPMAVLKRRECGALRIWAVEMGPGWRDPGRYLTPGFRLVREWEPHFGAMRLWLYQRTQPCGDASGHASRFPIVMRGQRAGRARWPRWRRCPGFPADMGGTGCS